jgi:hypothetical protein
MGVVKGAVIAKTVSSPSTKQQKVVVSDIM